MCKCKIPRSILAYEYLSFYAGKIVAADSPCSQQQPHMSPPKWSSSPCGQPSCLGPYPYGSGLTGVDTKPSLSPQIF